VFQSLTATTPPPPLNSQEFGAKGPGTYVTSINGHRVYRTNIDGIGYSIGGISGNNCLANSGWVGTDSIGDPNHFIFCSAKGQFAHQPLSWQAAVTFYKTSPSSDSDQVNSLKVASFILRNNHESRWV